MFEKMMPTILSSQPMPYPVNAGTTNRYYTPPVDIFDYDTELIVVADIPGADKEHTEISLEESTLTIQAKPVSPLQGRFIHREYEWGWFYRQFDLPDQVDRDRISAEMKNGVMVIHLPKKHPKKSIPVNVS